MSAEPGDRTDLPPEGAGSLPHGGNLGSHQYGQGAKNSTPHSFFGSSSGSSKSVPAPPVMHFGAGVADEDKNSQPLITLQDQKAVLLPIYACEYFALKIERINQEIKQDVDTSARVHIPDKEELEKTDHEEMQVIEVSSERKFIRQAVQWLHDYTLMLEVTEKTVNAEEALFFQDVKGQEWIQKVEGEFPCRIDAVVDRYSGLYATAPSGQWLVICSDTMAATDCDYIVLPLWDGQTEWSSLQRWILRKSALTEDITLLQRLCHDGPFTLQCNAKFFHGKTLIIMPVPERDTGVNKEKEQITDAYKKAFALCGEGQCSVAVHTRLTPKISLGKSLELLLKAVFETFQDESLSDKPCQVVIYIDNQQEYERACDTVQGAIPKSWHLKWRVPRTGPGKGFIKVCTGQIQEAEADVIVNSTNRTLIPNRGAVDSAIARAAGPEMLRACREQYPHGIAENGLAVTDSFHMTNAKKVYHIALSSSHFMEDNKQDLLHGLRQVILHCLLQASLEKHTSIAFPVLGVGQPRYPSDVVAKVMFSTASYFFREMPHTSLQTVLIVVYPQNLEALQRKLDLNARRSLKIFVGGFKGDRPIQVTFQFLALKMEEISQQYGFSAEEKEPLDEWKQNRGCIIICSEGCAQESEDRIDEFRMPPRYKQLLDDYRKSSAEAFQQRVHQIDVEPKGREEPLHTPDESLGGQDRRQSPDSSTGPRPQKVADRTTHVQEPTSSVHQSGLASANAGKEHQSAVAPGQTGNSGSDDQTQQTRYNIPADLAQLFLMNSAQVDRFKSKLMDRKCLVEVTEASIQGGCITVEIGSKEDISWTLQELFHREIIEAEKEDLDVEMALTSFSDRHSGKVGYVFEKGEWSICATADIKDEIHRELQKLKRAQHYVPLPVYACEYLALKIEIINHDIKQDVDTSVSVRIPDKDELEKTDHEEMQVIEVSSEKKFIRQAVQWLHDHTLMLEVTEKTVNAEEALFFQDVKGQEWIQKVEHEFPCRIDAVVDRYSGLYATAPSGQRLVVCRDTMAATDCDYIVLPLWDGQTEWSSLQRWILRRSFLTEDISSYQTQCRDGPFALQCNAEFFHGKTLIIVPVPERDTGTDKEKERIISAYKKAFALCGEGQCFVAVHTRLSPKIALGKSLKLLLKAVFETFQNESPSGKPYQVVIYIHNQQEYKKTCDTVLEAIPKSWHLKWRVQRTGSKKGIVKFCPGEVQDAKADVIVNATNRKLTPDKGAVERTIAAAAGPEMLRACREQYPQGIPLSGLAVTDSFNMKNARRIYHISFPSDALKEEKQKVLHDFCQVILHCLLQASLEKHTTIAFPALDSGQRLYPCDVVAKVIFSTASYFFREMPSTSLQTALIVVHPQNLEALQALKMEETSQQYTLSPEEMLSTDERKRNQGWIFVCSVKCGEEIAHRITEFQMPTKYKLLLDDYRKTCAESPAGQDRSKNPDTPTGPRPQNMADRPTHTQEPTPSVHQAGLASQNTQTLVSLQTENSGSDDQPQKTRYHTLSNQSQAGHDRNQGLAAQDRNWCLAGQDRNQGLAGQDRNQGLAGQDRNLDLVGQDRNQGLAGQDRNQGQAGQDRNQGQAGQDRNQGQAGQDRNQGQAGQDRNMGLAGQDRNMGLAGQDRNLDLVGQDRNQGLAGQDRNQGLAGQDRNQGLAGQDRNLGLAGQDRNQGLAGQDRNQGLAGQDRNQGLAGQDRNQGLAGQDRNLDLVGQDRNQGLAGQDRNQGQAGQDRKQGQAGQDSNQGQAGQDSNQGQRGQDSNQGLAGQDSNQGLAGQDRNQGLAGQDRNQGLAGQDRNLDLVGQDRNQGLAGQDRNQGLAGQDRNQGQAGQDRKQGQAGQDRNQGQAGQDSNRGQGGQDGNQGQGGQDSNQGLAGQDSNQGLAGQDRNQGLARQDRNQGQAGQDSNQGLARQDRNQGQAGQDSNQGLARQDSNQGQGGQDSNQGQGGQDSNQGQRGQDRNQGQAGQDSNQGLAGQDKNQGQAGQDRNKSSVTLTEPKSQEMEDRTTDNKTQNPATLSPNTARNYLGADRRLQTEGSGSDGQHRKIRYPIPEDLARLLQLNSSLVDKFKSKLMDRRCRMELADKTIHEGYIIVTEGSPEDVSSTLEELFHHEVIEVGEKDPGLEDTLKSFRNKYPKEVGCVFINGNWNICVPSEIKDEIHSELEKLKKARRFVPLPMYACEYLALKIRRINHDIKQDVDTSASVRIPVKEELEKTDHEEMQVIEVSSERKFIRWAVQWLHDYALMLEVTEKTVNAEEALFFQDVKGQEWIQKVEREFPCRIDAVVDRHSGLYATAPSGQRLVVCSDTMAATDCDYIVLPLWDGQTEWSSLQRWIVRKSFLSEDISSYQTQCRYGPFTLQCKAEFLHNKTLIIVPVPERDTGADKEKERIISAYKKAFALCGEGQCSVAVHTRLSPNINLVKSLKLLLHAVFETFRDESPSGKPCQVVIYIDNQQEYKKACDTVLKALPTPWHLRWRVLRTGLEKGVIKVCAGKIQEVEADVIVNSTNKTLFPDKGAVERAIATAAGPEMLWACRKQYPQGIPENGLAVTDSFNMTNAKKVYHIVLSSDRYTEDNKKDLLHGLRQVILRCLLQASLEKHTTIAFPVLGSGQLKYPSDVVAKVMFSTASYFFREMPHTSLQTVLIVVYPRDLNVIQAFKMEEISQKYRFPAEEGNSVDECGMQMNINSHKIQIIHGSVVDKPCLSDVSIEGDPASRKPDFTHDASGHWRCVVKPGRITKDDYNLYFREALKHGQTVQVAGDTLHPDTLKDMMSALESVLSCEWLTFKLVSMIFSDKEKIPPLSWAFSKVGKGFMVFSENTLKRNQGSIFMCYEDSGEGAVQRLEEFKMPTRYKQVLDDFRKTSRDHGSHTGKAEEADEISIAIPSNFLEHVNLSEVLESGRCQQKVEGKMTTFNVRQEDFEKTATALKQIIGNKPPREIIGNKPPTQVEEKRSAAPEAQSTEGWSKTLDDLEVEALRFLLKGQFDQMFVWKEHLLTLKGAAASPLTDKVNSLRREDVPLTDEEISKLGDTVETETIEAFVKTVPSEGKAAVFAFDHDAVTRAKHLVTIKAGRVKVTARGRRKFEAGNPGQQDQTQARSQDFSEHAAASNVQVETYKTLSGTAVLVYKTDITKLQVDAIVNAANESLDHGGGVALAISRAAGFALDDEGREHIRKHGQLRVTEVVETSAGNLPCQKVLHAVGPCWEKYTDKAQCRQHLVDTMFNCLRKADSLGFTSVALPSISSAIFGVPQDVCAESYLSAVKTFDSLHGQTTSLKQIHFVDVSDAMISIIQSTFCAQWGAPAGISPGGQGAPLTAGGRSSQEGSADPLQTRADDSHQKPPSAPYISDTERVGGLVHSPSTVAQSQDEPVGFPCVNEVGAGTESQVQVTFKGLDLTVIFQRQSLVDTGTDSVILWQDVQNALKDKTWKQFQKTLSPQVQNKINDWKKEMSTADKTVAFQTTNKQFVFVVLSSSAEYSEDRIGFFVEQAINRADLKEKRTVAISRRQKGDKSGKGTNKDKEDTKDFIGGLYKAVKNYAKRSLRSIREIHVMETDPNILQFMVDNVKTLIRVDRSLLDQGTPLPSTGTSDTSPALSSDACIFCTNEPPSDPKHLPCGHAFCRSCISKWFQSKPTCPSCGAVHGIVYGDQPEDGTMKIEYNNFLTCGGYPAGTGTYYVDYSFPSGTQTHEHPNPGQRYSSTTRRAYLPNTQEGRKVLMLLQVAFHRHLVFTIDGSATTGQEGIVWKDIHHKTSTFGGPSRFGYPDPNYFVRVLEELASKGVTEKDLSDSQRDFIENPTEFFQKYGYRGFGQYLAQDESRL